MENKTKRVNGVTSTDGSIVRVVDGVEYVVVAVSSGSDWHGRYGRRPRPRLKKEEEEEDGNASSAQPAPKGPAVSAVRSGILRARPAGSILGLSLMQAGRLSAFVMPCVIVTTDALRNIAPCRHDFGSAASSGSEVAVGKNNSHSGHAAMAPSVGILR